MNIFEKIKLELYCLTYDFRHKLEIKKYKKLYPDYEDDGYNCGSLKHIWGVKSWDDLSGKDCNFYTMNDIDITYDRDTKEYMLGIETAYIFKNLEAECKYLKELLNAFTIFMDSNNYSKDFNINLFMNGSTTKNTADSIEELYSYFKVFVEGYCKVAGY